MRQIDIRVIELLKDLSPRHQCDDYVHGHEKIPFLMSKTEFNEFYRQNRFKDGPYKDTFGDGEMEPYNPNRQAFGRLGDGKVVYCELSEHLQEKTEKLFKLMPEDDPISLE